MATKKYLGKALKFPIDVKFVPEDGIDLVLQDVQLLLLTRPGERVMRPRFGCGINVRLFDNLDTVANIGASDIAAAIREFEPRVSLLQVTPHIDRPNGLVIFQVRMLIRDANVERNLVFPFKPASELSHR